jgi:1-acyl-sn-glycerol-3-phosphate acyltransferase
MAKHNIEKYSSGYALLKFFARLWHNWVFYRRVIVMGRENVDHDCHNIFAPNHQNALMDALAVVCTDTKQHIYLARSDIYKKKFIASILYFLKILPVYRIRDGFDNLRLNDEIFLKTVEVIKHKNGIVILPEGNHLGRRRLRQLKKGICRIAFSAEEVNDFNLKIKIIPVGLEYSHYFRFRQVLTVVYGKPIEVSEYTEIYKVNPARAQNDLRDRLSEEMKKLMVHIETEEDYEAVNELRNIVNGRYSDRIKYPKIFRDRVLVDRINKLAVNNEDLYHELCDKSLFVKNSALDLKISYRHLEKKKHSLIPLLGASVLLLLSFPLFVYGMAFNYIFIEVPKMPLKNIADQQFHSSVRYVVSLLFAFIFMPLYAVLAFVLLKPWYLALAVLLSIPVSGFIAWNWAMLFRRVEGGFRIRGLTSSGNGKFLELKKAHIRLMEIVSSLKS